MGKSVGPLELDEPDLLVSLLIPTIASTTSRVLLFSAIGGAMNVDLMGSADGGRDRG